MPGILPTAACPPGLQLALERTYHLAVPGFKTEVKPYRRPRANDEHRANQAHVRRQLYRDAQEDQRSQR